MTTLLYATMALNLAMSNLDFGVDYIIKFALLQIPTMLVYTMPIALVCSIVYTIQLLHSDNELLMLELSGINKITIARPILVFMFISMIIAQLMYSFIIPAAKKYLLVQKETLHKNIASSLLKEKVFTKISNKLMVYIDHRIGPKDLKGIIIHDKTNTGTTSTILAERGVILDNGNKIIFKLQNGSRQSLVKDNFQVLYFKSWLFDISDYSERLFNVGGFETHSIYKLIKTRFTKQLDNYQITKIDQEIHRRFSWPLLIIALPMLFLFSSFNIENSREKTMKSILFSVILALISIFLYFLSMSRIVLWKGFIVLSYLNPIFFSILGLYIFKKTADCSYKIPCKNSKT